MTVFLAMVLYPDVQRKAQEEIDKVVGKDTLPTFDDMESLPYVKAVCTEALRCMKVSMCSNSALNDLQMGCCNAIG